jgi:hypothetical protein
MLSELPTAEEKTEIQARLLDLQAFIEDLNKSLASISAIEDTARVSESIDKLSELLAKAQSNATMGPLLGVHRIGQRKLRGSEPLTKVQIDAAKREVQELNKLPIDEIRSRLSGENYPLANMRAIARALGMRPSERLSREQLFHQIATKIANSRGYERLRESS